MGFVVWIEIINMLDVYLGSFLGYGVENVCCLFINMMNLVDLLLISMIWMGFNKVFCLMYLLLLLVFMYCVMYGVMLFCFNLYVCDLGYIFMFGFMGVGKLMYFVLIVV